MHPDAVLAGDEVKRNATDATAEAAKEARALLAELDEGSLRDDLEEALCRATARVAVLGAERREEARLMNERRDNATAAWRDVVDAHDILSDEKKRAEVDRRQSAEAVGNALGTLGGVAFVGLGQVAKFGLDVASSALADYGNETNAKAAAAEKKTR